MKIKLNIPGGYSLYFNTNKLERGAAKIAALAADKINSAKTKTAGSDAPSVEKADAAKESQTNKVYPDKQMKSSTATENLSAALSDGGRIARRTAKAAVRVAAAAAESASEIASSFKEDVDAVCQRDPAVHSKAEAALLYSGVHAISAYRIAHRLYKNKHYFSARLISQGARFLTGIEIHPGAKIGHGLFIDHGSGVVIGETTVIGDGCTLYQGVTLGGTGKETGKRHPTLGNNVMVGAGAKLLGAFTVGDNTKIAAGAVVLSDVPENSTAVGIPARVVRRAGERVCGDVDLDQTHIPDPVSQELCRLECTVQRLETRIAELESKQNTSSEDNK